MESKLIDFFAFLSFLANSQFWESSVRTIGNFPGFLSALASNNAFIIKLVMMWTSRTLVGTLKISLDRLTFFVFTKKEFSTVLSCYATIFVCIAVCT